MTRTLPAEPACWDWTLPPLPLPCDKMRVRRWQQERCAVCGVHVPVYNRLLEDHDHVTGDTRGWLCEPCNLAEGRPGAAPVFQLYRDRHPTRMLGVLARRKAHTHPATRAAEVAWQVAEVRVLLGPPPFGPDPADEPGTSELVAYARRVGYQPAEPSVLGGRVGQ